MSDEKLFSLRVIPSTGAPEDKRHYATLAEAIEDYKQIQEHTDHSVLSLLFKELVLAEDKDLLDLSDDQDWLIPERNDRKSIMDARDPGTKEKTPMTREEFEAALDEYEERGEYFPYYTGSSNLEEDPVRDFLWDLMNEGISAVDKLPPKLEAWEPIDWRHQPVPVPGDRYGMMNREVQELLAGGERLESLLELYSKPVTDGALSLGYGHTEGFTYYTTSSKRHCGSLPMIVYAKPNRKAADPRENPWRIQTYTVMSVLGERLDVPADLFDELWQENMEVSP